MTDLQLKILKQVQTHPMSTISFMDWAVQGVRPNDITSLQKEGYITIQMGEGFVGGLRTIQLTEKGSDFISNYCDCCECLPCDCGYGS